MRAYTHTGFFTAEQTPLYYSSSVLEKSGTRLSNFLGKTKEAPGPFRGLVLSLQTRRMKFTLAFEHHSSAETRGKKEPPFDSFDSTMGSDGHHQCDHQS